MPITIQRGRQFLAGDATASVFDKQGKAGGYLTRAGQKLVEQGATVQLQATKKTTLTLKTADDWKQFEAKYASSSTQTAAFAKKFGITFEDFLSTIDDVAAGDEKGLTLDLRPTSDLAKALSLDKVEGNYAATLAKDQAVKLTGRDGAVVEAKAADAPVIGASILDKPIGTDWERDRTECEAWADFKLGDGANKKFKENSGSAALAKLNNAKWDDPEAMALVDAFTMPVKVEETTDAAGKPQLQDRDEMFRETYFDDRSGSLSKAGAAVRARVRFDDKEPFPVRRVLIQAKEGRAVDGAGSAVHKFEKRFDGSYTDELKAQDMLRHGVEEGGEPLKVAQVLYKLAKDKGTLPADGGLRLEPKEIVLQKRRRSHVQFENVENVTTKRDALVKDIAALKTANQPVPPAMQKYADKLDSQVKFLTEAKEILSRNGQWLPSNTDGFIISADRYSVYDPAARGGKQPNDIDDETGRVGRGLHVEAEWDTASSDPFQKSTDAIQKQLADPTTPAEKKPQLEADLKRLNEMSAIIRADVAKSVEVLKQRLVKGGLEVDPAKKSKEQRAADFMAAKDRTVNWL